MALKVVTDAIGKAYEFKSELEELKSTLEAITPTLQEIDKFNGVLDIPGRETAKLKEEMIKGAKLVRESSKVKRFSCFNRVKYADKIIKLKKSIESWCNVIMQTQMARDNKRILVEVLKMRSVNEKGARVEIDGPCSVPDSLGAVFGEVLNVVKDTICKAYKFKPELQELKSTLESITPNLQEIDKLNGVLDIPGPETAKLKEEMIKGAKLVRESSKVKRFSCFNGVKYADKIIKLKKSIESWCKVIMQTQMATDNKRILVEVVKMRSVNEKGVEDRVEIDGPCSVPDSLGAVFGEVLNVVKDAICKAYKFKSELEELKSTLESIAPTLQEIDKFNGVLDIPGPETAKLRKDMIKGAKLVCESSKVKRFSFFDRVNYADKIIKLKKSIETFCNVNMQIQMARDNKRILVEVDTMVKMFNRVEIDGPCSVPDSLASTPGLDVPMKELRTELLKDDGMQVIVVSAPGGAGKTTLIKKLCADDKVKDKFQENIFFVTVSKTHDVMAIVRRIFQHKKCEVPTFQTDEAAIKDLERLLNSIGQAILLVLDDVWSESLVQKFKFKLPNYKILVTSRSVFPQFGSGHQLKPLNDEAAMILFRSLVTPQDGEPYFFDENLANKILRVCKGSPLALTVVGRLLCGEPAAIWQSKVKEWDQGVSIFISGNELLVCLQSSLDALDEEVKEC